MNIEEQIKHIEYLRGAELEARKRWLEAETAEHGAAVALKYCTAELDKAVSAFVEPLLGPNTLESVACRLARQR